MIQGGGSKPGKIPAILSLFATNLEFYRTEDNP
jgi:hypothetical protein